VPNEVANALPTKKFFLEMLTRDISLEDSVLDLVDNCIDALARTRKLHLNESLLNEAAVEKMTKRLKAEGMPVIHIDVSRSVFKISDHCGGIDIDHARNDVFRFGRVADEAHSKLSVYGIGLKRAIFKLGREIKIESKTASSGFRVEINTDQWSKNDRWNFPLTETSATKNERRAGTTITVRRLNDDVQLRLDDGQFRASLADSIASAYSLFLDKLVVIRLNGKRIAAKAIPLGMSSSVTPATETSTIGDVKLTLLSGLAERVGAEWTAERAGWYVFCNGRVVVQHDTTELTGWGISAPVFHSKYRGFVGLAFFFSEDPESLPWTTTKRGLNTESRAYILARNKMAVLARPVLSFLNGMYAAGEPEELAERKVASTVKAATLSDAIKASSPTFKAVVVRQLAIPSTVTVQYSARIKDVDAVRKHIGRPTWSASKVGLHTLEYFVKQECGK
jgi:hypothetical protein